jgi:probable phosphoglycerate mutase
VAARADSLIATLRGGEGHTLLFSSGHLLRLLAARWLGQPAADGAHFMLDTASLSALGYEHALQQPVIRLWNDTRHVQD